MTRLLLIRHAEPDASVRGRVYGRLDVALSEAGRAGAEALAAALDGEPIDALYTSPLRRALETAAPLAAARGLPAVPLDGLRELDFGELEGLSLTEVAARHSALLEWTVAPADVRFPGGESVHELRRRALATVRELIARHPHETVCAFTHAVVIRAVLADALAMPPDGLFRLDQSYGGISLVEWHDGLPYVRSVNATTIPR